MRRHSVCFALSLVVAFAALIGLPACSEKVKQQNQPGDSSDTHGFKPDALIVKIRHAQADCKPFADAKDICLESAHWQLELTDKDKPARKATFAEKVSDLLPSEPATSESANFDPATQISDRQVVIDADARMPAQFLETILLAACRSWMWNLVLCCGEEVCPLPLPVDARITPHADLQKDVYAPGMRVLLVRDEKSGRTLARAGKLWFDGLVTLQEAFESVSRDLKRKRISLESVKREGLSRTGESLAPEDILWANKPSVELDNNPDVPFAEVVAFVQLCAKVGCQVPEFALHGSMKPRSSGVSWPKKPGPAGEIPKNLPPDLSPMLVMVEVAPDGRRPYVLILEKPEEFSDTDAGFGDDGDVVEPVIKEDTPDHEEVPDDSSGLNDKEDLDFISDKGVFDSMGIGSGVGRKYGGMLGGRRLPDLKGGGKGETTEAVVAGLAWLAKHQGPEGNWDSDGFSALCKDAKCSGPGHPGHDVGVTGLALLAFLSAGHTHLSRGVVGGVKCSDVLKNGLLWLQKNQDASGRFCPETGVKHVLDHALATLAMCEVYGMTQSPLFEKSATKGIEYLIKARTKGRAWRYEFQPGDNDMCVTGWCVMALKSAERAGIDVGQSNFNDALKFLGEVTDETTGLVGYKTRGDATTSVAAAGMNDKYKSHPTMTAMGMLVRMFIEIDEKSKTLATQAKVLTEDLPERGKDGLATDYHYWFLGTFALCTYADMSDKGGESHDRWRQWREIVQKAAIENQKKKDADCAAGSWDADDRWGYEGGRVYATALGTLTLDLCRRFDRGPAPDTEEEKGK